MSTTSLPKIFTTSQPNSTNHSEQNPCIVHYTSIHYTLLAVILVFALLGNGFICVAFILRRKLRTVTNYFVVNLAVADCLLVVLWLIWAMFYVFCVVDIGMVYLFLQTIEHIFSSASVVGLAVVSYDRFYAVNHALHYGSTMTHRRALKAIVGVWVYSTVTAFLRWGALDLSIREMYLRAYTIALFIFNFFIPFMISAYCYVRIFLIAMQHLRHGFPANQLLDPLSKASTVRKQLKISLNIFVLAVPFLFMWNGYYGLTVYEVLRPTSILYERYSPVDDLLSNLPQIVAAINPVIFIFLTKDLRTTAMMCVRSSTYRRDRFRYSDTYVTSTKYTTNYQGKDDFVSKV